MSRRRPRVLQGFGKVTTTCSPVRPGNAIKLCMTRPEQPGKAFRHSGDVCAFLRATAGADRESIHVIHLDAQNRPIGIEEVAKGTLNNVESSPREIFKGALLSNAAAILIAHNHPSGNPQASDADLQLTYRLLEVGRTLGIPIRDHVIVAAEGCNSLRDTGKVTGFGTPPRGRRRSRKA